MPSLYRKNHRNRVIANGSDSLVVDVQGPHLHTAQRSTVKNVNTYSFFVLQSS